MSMEAAKEMKGFDAVKKMSKKNNAFNRAKAGRRETGINCKYCGNK